MIDLQIGEIFESQSKIQKEPIKYVYRGLLSNGRYFLEATSGIEIDDCEVDEIWFDNRKITKEAHHEE